METNVTNYRVLQNAAATGNGTAIDLRGVTREVTVYIEGSGAVTAGAVQLETADSISYSGTWAALGTATTVVAGAILTVLKTGCFKAFRARISTNVLGTTGTATGGSVSTVVKAAAGWTIDKFIGCTVTMTGGTAGNIGQVRTVVDNDATTLYVSPNFPFAVANLDTFEISGTVSVRIESN